jgi:hypothetical protein
VESRPHWPAPALTAEAPDLIVIRPSPIAGLGAFAARPIPAGARVLEYLGERISKAESLRRCAADNTFIFALDDESDLDGNVPWNPARFLNHSCAPNCEAVEQEGHIWIIALQFIRVGEELTFNYGYDLESYHEHPCRCGAPECVGYIVAEEFFPSVRRQNQVRRAATAG